MPKIRKTQSLSTRLYVIEFQCPNCGAINKGLYPIGECIYCDEKIGKDISRFHLGRGKSCIICHKSFANNEFGLTCPICDSMYHPKCGDSLFKKMEESGEKAECPQCSSIYESLNSLQKVAFCQQCGASLPDGQNSCNFCG